MKTSARINNLLKEPLLHFLLIGAALFLLNGWRGNSASVPGGPAATPTTQILVTQDDIEQMSNLFARTWQRPPSAEERQRLIDDLVRNEIYYREALALGLDRDDAVLKRRLRQKMEFISEDISSLGEPTDADLQAFMQQHQEKYRADPQLAFRQIYFNPDKRGKSTASEARQALAQLTHGSDPETVGDPTLLQAEVPLAALWEIRKEFGEEFTSNLLALKPGGWTGPIRSGFGLHLVFVSQRADGQLPALSAIRATVQRDWTVERQQERKDAAYAKIRERYAVTVEQPQALAVSTETQVTTQ